MNAGNIVCPNCGTLNYPTSPMCYNCRLAFQPIPGLAPDGQQYYQQPPGVYRAKKSSGVGWLFGGIAIGILVVIVACVAVFMIFVAGVGTAVTQIAEIRTSSDLPAQELRQGQSAETAGWKITVHGMRREREGSVPASEGNEYVLVDVSFENKSNFAGVMSSFLNTSLKDSSGKTYGPSLTANPTSMPDDVIAKGRTVRGEIGFDVPTNAEGLTFVFDPLLGGGVLRFKLADD